MNGGNMSKKECFQNNQTGENSKIDIDNTSGGPQNWVTKLMNHLFQANDWNLTSPDKNILLLKDIHHV